MMLNLGWGCQCYSCAIKGLFDDIHVDFNIHVGSNNWLGVGYCIR